MEENHGTGKENHRTIEEHHGKIEENHGKIYEHHGQINENHGQLDKNHGTNSETSGKIDEQCEWEILATKCSNWEIWAAKTKEGSLDDKKTNCRLNSAPDLILYDFITYLAVCQNLVPLVNIKIAGKWMFIPLKLILIGFDPSPSESIFSISPPPWTSSSPRDHVHHPWYSKYHAPGVSKSESFSCKYQWKPSNPKNGGKKKREKKTNATHFQ